MKNKGFSLVELIIVIAIMAILVGIAAPLLFKYIEKANVSADFQLCSSIQEAVNIASTDPDVVTATDDSSEYIDKLNDGTVCKLDASFFTSGSDSVFSDNVKEIMGYNVFDEDDNRIHMSSKLAKDAGVIYCQKYNDDFYVWINNSNNSGMTNQAYSVADASALNDNSKVIFVN